MMIPVFIFSDAMSSMLFYRCCHPWSRKAVADRMNRMNKIQWIRSRPPALRAFGFAEFLSLVPNQPKSAPFRNYFNAMTRRGTVRVPRVRSSGFSLAA
jgi:hypothetical protein